MGACATFKERERDILLYIKNKIKESNILFSADKNKINVLLIKFSVYKYLNVFFFFYTHR